MFVSRKNGRARCPSRELCSFAKVIFDGETEKNPDISIGKGAGATPIRTVSNLVLSRRIRSHARFCSVLGKKGKKRKERGERPYTLLCHTKRLVAG